MFDKSTTLVEAKAKEISEDIKHIDENGNEYWGARELMEILEYSKKVVKGRY